MKVRSGVVTAVIACIITIMSMLQAEDAVALDIYPYLEGGSLINESDATLAGGGFVINNKWDIGTSITSVGDTKWGDHDKIKILSVSRIIQPGWFGNHVFGMAGVSKIKNSAAGVPDINGPVLVGEINFNLGLGFQWRTGKILCMHYSSLNVNDVNHGVNACKLRLNF